jgi:hypothetical protein
MLAQLTSSRMLRIVRIAALVLVAASVAASGSPGATPRPPRWVLHGKYTASIDPSNFVASVDNRYFPLTPGTSFHYRGVRGTTAQTDDVVVTRGVKYVLGVKCTVVRDTVSERGRPVERTFDWYAQDVEGNVWYMGEDSFELQNGRFARASDSWQAGKNGAQPGIIMRGQPRSGQVYRQEYYPPGEALDQARVLGLQKPLRVPAGTFTRPLVTIEWSPVEPQLEKKYYAAGVGEVMEKVVAGGHEQFELVRVTHKKER